MRCSNCSGCEYKKSEFVSESVINLSIIQAFFKKQRTVYAFLRLNGLNALSQGEEASNSEIQIPTPMNREQDKSQAPNPNADRERDRAEGEATAVSASPEDLPGKHRAWHIEQRACGLEPVNGSELLDALEGVGRGIGFLRGGGQEACDFAGVGAGDAGAYDTAHIRV